MRFPDYSFVKIHLRRELLGEQRYCSIVNTLLQNMVGPGEVDEDLEPEVKDECNTKYGEVVRVVIFEQPNVPSDEAVRIFVEFRRIESAIKGESF